MKEYIRSLLMKRTYLSVGIVLVILSIGLFPFHRINSMESADNPSKARYYISLQSILANYQLLSADKANVRFIKNRLIDFEKDTKRHGKVTSEYKQQYLAILKEFGVKSIREIVNSELIIIIAKKSMRIIDEFYLDSRLFPSNPLYYWNPSHSRRILQYNLGGLFDNMPNRYMRIVAAYPNDSQLGVYSGFFVNNQTTTLETQFMTGIPMLTALYVMPKYDYGATGSLNTMVPWGYFNVRALGDPVIRKMLDISGIDIFGVLRSQMATDRVHSIKGTVAFKPEVWTVFSGDYLPYLNDQSYGMAYLANRVQLEQPERIKVYENRIKNYFSHPIDHDPKDFLETVNVLYSKLLALKDKRDIILEKTSLQSFSSEKDHVLAGSVQVKGIVGERVLLNSNCNRESCSLVLNIADSPGWHATVNGHHADINRANFAFMSVDVPKGDATVWFIYSPLTSVVSYFVSILSLLGLLLTCRKEKAI